MAEEHKHEIQFEKKRPVRTKIVKVTLFDSEFKLLEDKNPYNSVAKLLRESALKAVKQEVLFDPLFFCGALQMQCCPQKKSVLILNKLQVLMW